MPHAEPRRSLRNTEIFKWILSVGFSASPRSLRERFLFPQKSPKYINDLTSLPDLLLSGYPKGGKRGVVGRGDWMEDLPRFLITDV